MMIKVAKIKALCLMLIMAVVSGYSLSGVDWGNKNLDSTIFRELRRPSMYLSLTIFYMVYYFRMLHKEKRATTLKKR
ncbi:MAG: hypothetical protein P8P28_04110 [Polaribacter sp.]|nr:hypothetical protein [Polaribacter sp.]MDG1321195.1 hypothetical protein [Polaribacter sp.]